MTATRNRAASRIGLVAGGLLMALLTSELLVRVFDVPPRPLRQVPFHTYQLSDDPIRGYEYRPGYRPEDTPFDRDHVGFAINSAGFRDDEHAVRKPPGTVRIVFLGDSTTAGNGVPERRAIYSEVVERFLEQRADGHHYESINLGVGGYHPVQEARTLETRGLSYDPDTVVMLLCQNDFSLQGDGGVYGMLSRVNARRDPIASPMGPLTRVSRLAFIADHLFSWDEENAAYLTWYRHEVLHGRSPAEVGIERLATLQRTHGFTAWVALLPALNDGYGGDADRARFARVQRAVASSAGLRFFDPRAAFGTSSRRVGRFARDGLHMNAAGHRAFGEALAPLLIEDR